jgi:hypothetical protein
MKRARYFLIILVLLSLPLAAAVIGALVPGSTPPAASAQLSDVMQLAEAASNTAPPATPAPVPPPGEVRGAPLNAPPAVTADTPEGENPETQGLQRIRTIPKASVDLMQQLEGPQPQSPDIVFEKTKNGKFTKLTFSALGSYQYEVPDPDIIRGSADPTKPPKDQIPAKIKALNGEEVIVVGFMVPIEITREGKVKSFALTVNQTFCCFGVPPAMNEWVMVEMEEGKTAPYTMDIPVAAYGKFAVGEEIEDGYVLSIYRMTSHEVIDVHELLKRTQDAS